ncbi:phage integrase family protein [Nonomuraea basaltis]|nr:phage integrase family protein [Nonomuraea basaltis]
MINEGVARHVVQRLYGHESSEMTTVYARAHRQDPAPGVRRVEQRTRQHPRPRRPARSRRRGRLAQGTSRPRQADAAQRLSGCCSAWPGMPAIGGSSPSSSAVSALLACP